MGVLVEDGAMVIVDDTVDPPNIVFDSEEKLFTPTNFVTGSVTLPERQAVTINGTNRFPVTIDDNHVLGSVHPDADVVLGGFEVTTFGGAQGISGLGVYNAGGTYVHYMDGAHAPLVGPPLQYSNNNLVNFAAYRFFVEDGTLYLNEFVRLDAWNHIANITLTLTLLSIQLDYKLFVGTLV